MKPFLAFIFFLLLVGGFILNRSYASIYNKIDADRLVNPNQTGAYLIGKAPFISKRIKYVALGDSLTAGVGVTNSKDTYPHLLSEHLIRPGLIIELINLGFPSAKTQDLIDSQLQQAVSSNPDIVTVLIGVNDVHDLISQEKFKKNYQDIIDQLTSKTKAKVIVINIPYIGSKKLIKWPYTWLYDMRIRQFNSIIKTIAQNKDLTLIDLYAATKDRSISDPDYYSIDQFHPSIKGYQNWGQILSTNTHF